jgi:hypothetical protein
LKLANSRETKRAQPLRRERLLFPSSPKSNHKKRRRRRPPSASAADDDDAAMTGAAAWPVCTICYEDLRPLSDQHLHCLPACGHVFHALWFVLHLAPPPLRIDPAMAVWMILLES